MALADVPTISLRCSGDERAELDQRAGCAGMTRTAFILRAALDQATEDERRFAEIEARLARAEALLFEP
jgi:uncharacterized protein (DUF1778 family)